MKEEIVKEIMKECNVKDKIVIKVLINICNYYKINDVKDIAVFIAKWQNFDNTLTTN